MTFCWCCSVTQSSSTLCDPMDQSVPSLPVHHQHQESTQTHVHRVSDVIQPSHPLSFPSPPALNLSQHQCLSNESALRMRWPKYWSFSFNISLSKEQPGPISFKMDWLDLLAVQGTLKSLLQHHSSKASILHHSAFFIVQLSHPYMTTGKTIALTRRTFVGKVMPLLFNALSRLVITFLPRSKRLLISWLQSSKYWTEVLSFCPSLPLFFHSLALFPSLHLCLSHVFCPSMTNLLFFVLAFPHICPWHIQKIRFEVKLM